MENCKRTPLAPGVYFNEVPDSVFKTVILSVNFVLPPVSEQIPSNALLAYLLCRGKDRTAVNRRLEALYGASLTPEVRKIGEKQVVSVTVSTVRDRFAFGNKAVLPAAQLLCELIGKPFVADGAFDAAATEAEKQNLVSMIMAQQNDKRKYAINRILAAMFGDRPYGLEENGSAEQAAAITGADAYKAWRRAMENAQVEILFIGEGGDEVKGLFEKLFGAEKRSPVSFDKVGWPEEHAVAEVTERMDVTQAKLILGYRTADMLPANTAPFEVMNCMYGMSTTSKLFTNVREKLSLCYYCQSMFASTVGMMLVDSGIQPVNYTKARDEIELQLRAMAEGKFTAAELAEAKLFMENIYRGVYGTPESLRRYWASQIITGEMKTPADKFTGYNAVTAEQVSAAARGCRLDTVYLLTENEKEGK